MRQLAKQKGLGIDVRTSRIQRMKERIEFAAFGLARSLAKQLGWD